MKKENRILIFAAILHVPIFIFYIYFIVESSIQDEYRVKSISVFITVAVLFAFSIISLFKPKFTVLYMAPYALLIGCLSLVGSFRFSGVYVGTFLLTLIWLAETGRGRIKN